jgi:hypothetical protein
MVHVNVKEATSKSPVVQKKAKINRIFLKLRTYKPVTQSLPMKSVICGYAPAPAAQAEYQKNKSPFHWDLVDLPNAFIYTITYNALLANHPIWSR